MNAGIIPSVLDRRRHCGCRLRRLRTDAGITRPHGGLSTAAWSEAGLWAEVQATHSQERQPHQARRHVVSHPAPRVPAKKAERAGVRVAECPLPALRAGPTCGAATDTGASAARAASVSSSTTRQSVHPVQAPWCPDSGRRPQRDRATTRRQRRSRPRLIAHDPRVPLSSPFLMMEQDRLKTDHGPAEEVTADARRQTRDARDDRDAPGCRAAAGEEQQHGQRKGPGARGYFAKWSRASGGRTSLSAGEQHGPR